MRLEVVPYTVECSNNIPQAFASSVPESFNTYSSSKKDETGKKAPFNFLSNPFVSKNLFKSQAFTKIPRVHTIPRSYSANLDGIYHKEPSRYIAKSSNLHSRFDLLEPVMLGIRPEFQNRQDEETVFWSTIEHKAKNFDLPLSLRMIKKKLQLEEGFTDSEESAYCSVNTAFATMVFIIDELQSHALEMRESLCREDLDIIIAKMQKEMHSSFLWLFQQVFSRTPDLMLHVMTLLANFSVYSASHISSNEDKEIRHILSNNSSAGNELVRLEEMNLWDSIVDEVADTREGIEGGVIDHDTVQHFVSPVSVELEPDGYEEYLRTDLQYQLNLSHEPNNPLLLSNYAQFLQLVAHDYDRAEECFKRAIKVLPPDAESLNQYANFLWIVRRDFWGAEERFLQALGAEPDNSYYASRYANFLWSNNGGEETCFPLNNSHNLNL